MLPPMVGRIPAGATYQSGEGLTAATSVDEVAAYAVASGDDAELVVETDPVYADDREELHDGDRVLLDHHR